MFIGLLSTQSHVGETKAEALLALFWGVFLFVIHTHLCNICLMYFLIIFFKKRRAVAQFKETGTDNPKQHLQSGATFTPSTLIHLFGRMFVLTTVVLR